MFGFSRSHSEVADLMAQIDAESEAMFQALNGFSKMASHESINARYNRLGQLGNQLGKYIGKDAAIGVISDAMNRQ